MTNSAISFQLIAASHLIFHNVFVLGVVDLNPQQIQYVSDHLTDEKCEQLLESLKKPSFEIPPESGATRPPREAVKQRPCVVELTKWTKTKGQDMTFDFLALRLKEIGLSKVADKLSRSVLGETSEELHEFFLDDPFKDMVPTKSVMIDKPDSETKMIPLPNNNDDDKETLFVAVIVAGALCGTFCTSLAICLACPRTGQYVCERACPAMCASSYEVMTDGCHQLWYGSKKSMDKYLFVSPRGGEGGLLV